jgi:titin
MFRVSAVNAKGQGKGLDSELVTPSKAPEAPGKPVGPLEAKDINRTAITLRWQEPETDGGSPLTGYMLEQREAKRTQWTKVTTVKPDNTTYQVSHGMLIACSLFFYVYTFKICVTVPG